MTAARLGVRGTADPSERRVRRLLRVARLLGLATLGLLAATALTPSVEWLARRYGEPARIAPAGAIVVLGGDVRPEGELDIASWRRLVHGILLYRQGLAPLLVLSGVTPRIGPSEPEVRARLARELGVPPAGILAVLGANTTREEAVRVAAELGPRRVRTVLLVSAPLHLVRARAVFERQGLEVLPAPVEDIYLGAGDPGKRLTLARVLAQELTGWLYYRLAGYL